MKFLCAKGRVEKWSLGMNYVGPSSYLVLLGPQ